MQARHQVSRQERTIAWHADKPRDLRRILRRPIKAGQNSGERTGIFRHVVGNSRQSRRGGPDVRVGIEDDTAALRPKAIEDPIKEGAAADLNLPFVASAHAARESAGQHYA
jgi:hypothetical protein